MRKRKYNKSLNQDKKQFAFFRTSNILANNFLPLNEALYHFRGLGFVFT